MGCSLSTPDSVGTIGEVDIPSGLYLLAQFDAYQTAADLASDDQDTTKVSSFLKATITVDDATGETAVVSDYVAQKTLENLESYAAIETRFDELGGVLTPDEETQADSYASQLMEQNGDLYKANGIGLDTLKRFERILIKSNDLLEMCYGTDGEAPVSDAELTSHLEDEMVYIRYVVVPLYNTSTYASADDDQITQMLAPENLRRLIKTDNDSLKLEYAARDKSAFFMMTVVPMAWKENRLTRVMMIVQDMGEQHLLQSLANTDGLTGLLNKRYFDRVLTVLEQHSQPFALFYMDLDRFKPVNDTYGHDVGDELLKGVSQRLQGCIRSRDYAFRLGGDEFALLLLGSMKPEACASKMNMICEMVAVPYEIDGNTVSVGASCGYALYPAESVDVQQVRCIADQRMYENKQANHARQDGAESI